VDKDTTDRFNLVDNPLLVNQNVQIEII
jgi:hypothetical protein